MEEIIKTNDEPTVHLNEVSEEVPEEPAKKDTAAPGSAKNIPLLIYIVIFFVLALLPFTSMLFDLDGENKENRSLAQKPQLFIDSAYGVELNTDFGREFESYLSDNFGFRQEVITVWSAAQYYIFGNSAVKDVITGKDGWLFYSSTVEDFEGTNLYSDRMIFRIAKTTQLMNAYAEDSGVAFVFTVAPNKATVYPEYMSGKYKPAQVTNLSRLSETLEGSGYYVDLAELFGEKLDGETQYYYKYDSHWNNSGALEVYRELQKALSAQLSDYTYDAYPDMTYIQTEHTGDLFTMLMPQLNVTENDSAYDIAKLYTSKAPLIDRLALDIETACPQATASLYMFRDSFGSPLIDTFSNNYSRVTYSRALPYDLRRAVEDQYNAIIVQIVERNLDELVARVPITETLPCGAPEKSERSDISAVCESELKDGSLNISGILSDDIELSTYDSIYLEFRGTDNRLFFEAFPICEGDAFEDRGFSAAVSASEFLHGEYTMYLHVGNEDKTTAYELFIEP